jgi:hypothetical protein
LHTVAVPETTICPARSLVAWVTPEFVVNVVVLDAVATPNSPRTPPPNAFDNRSIPLLV